MAERSPPQSFNFCFDELAAPDLVGAAQGALTEGALPLLQQPSMPPGSAPGASRYDGAPGTSLGSASCEIPGSTNGNANFVGSAAPAALTEVTPVPPNSAVAKKPKRRLPWSSRDFASASSPLASPSLPSGSVVLEPLGDTTEPHRPGSFTVGAAPHRRQESCPSSPSLRPENSWAPCSFPSLPPVTHLTGGDGQEFKFHSAPAQLVQSAEDEHRSQLSETGGSDHQVKASSFSLPRAHFTDESHPACKASSFNHVRSRTGPIHRARSTGMTSEAPRCTQASLSPLGWSGQIVSLAKFRGWSVASSIGADGLQELGKAELLIDLPAPSAMLVIGRAAVLPALRRFALDYHQRDVTRFRPQLVAVLEYTGTSQPDQRQVIETLQELMVCGYDDVIVKKPCIPDFDLAVLMSITRSEMKKALIDEMETAFAERLHQQDEQYSHHLDAELLDNNNRMFWRSAHKLYDGFPKLQMDVDANPCCGTCIVGRTLQKPLGKGGFGLVYTCLGVDMKLEAVKVIDKRGLADVDPVGKLWREIKAMNVLAHENIVGYLSAAQGPGHIFLFMEHAGESNLTSPMRRSGKGLDIETARCYQEQLASAVAHCHSRGIAHRDLKPENVAVSNCGSRIKVLDFGCAVAYGSKCFDIVGTMPFIPPEVLSVGRDRPYKPAGCDTWACGVVLLEMLCGVGKLSRVLQWDFKLQPSQERRLDLVNFFAEPGAVGYLLEDLSETDDALVEVLEGLLCVEPERRWRADRIAACAWFGSCSEEAEGLRIGVR